MNSPKKFRQLFLPYVLHMDRNGNLRDSCKNSANAVGDQEFILLQDSALMHTAGWFSDIKISQGTVARQLSCRKMNSWSLNPTEFSGIFTGAISQIAVWYVGSLMIFHYKLTAVLSVPVKEF